MDPVINTTLDRATLDGFVDGALSPEAAARVVLHLADCPADQAYVDAVMETNALLAAAYAAPLHDPLPERLRAAIFPAPAAPERPAARAGWRAALRRPRRALWGALAASCALALGLGIGLAPKGDLPEAQIAGPPLRAASGLDAQLRAALETRPSGAVAETAGGAQITLIASFEDDAGRPCREFEILDVVAGALTEGVACRAPAGRWAFEIAVASPLAAPERSGGAYLPASGAGAEALGATLDRIGASMALTPPEEAALIASGWAR